MARTGGPDLRTGHILNGGATRQGITEDMASSDGRRDRGRSPNGGGSGLCVATGGVLLHEAQPI